MQGHITVLKSDAKEALNSGDPKRMNSAREKLTQASHKLAEQMYRAAQPQGGGAPGAGPTPGSGAQPSGGAASANGKAKEGEVIDAEYVDVEDKK